MNTIIAKKRCMEIIEHFPEDRLPELVISLEHKLKESTESDIAVKTRRSIQELFELFPAEYIEDEELDWGEPVGDEVW